MKKYYVYIVLTRTNTVISRIIHGIKREEYTHASISLDMQLHSMYSFGRKNTYNPFIGTFRKEDIDKGVFNLCDVLPGAIIQLEVTRLQYERVKMMIEIFISNKHIYKYNYMGLIHNLLNKPAVIENRFLCSEFVYYLLKESGIINLHISRNLVRPQSFIHIDGKIIYKGDLKSFNLTNDYSIEGVTPLTISAQFD